MVFCAKLSVNLLFNVLYFVVVIQFVHLKTHS
jgi:hypothetical protein